MKVCHRTEDTELLDQANLGNEDAARSSRFSERTIRRHIKGQCEHLAIIKF